MGRIDEWEGRARAFDAEVESVSLEGPVTGVTTGLRREEETALLRGAARALVGGRRERAKRAANIKDGPIS